MIAYLLVEASAGCLTALVSLWCATSPRHWAVRWGLAVALAMTALLARAHEPVVQMMSTAALVAVGVAIYRRRQAGHRFFPRWNLLRMSISLRGLLLATVFVSVTAAFASRMPEFDWNEWGQILHIGVFTALHTLLAAWMVFGKTKPRRRITVGFLAFPLALLATFITAAPFQFRREGYATIEGLQLAYEWWFMPSTVSWWFSGIGFAISLGFAFLLVLLTATRQSGWFGAPDVQGGWSRLARAILVCPVVLMAILMVALIWELAHPTPVPAITYRQPDRWEEFIAEMPAATAYRQLTAISTPEELEPWSPRIEKLAALLEEPIQPRSPYEYVKSHDHASPIWDASTALPLFIAELNTQVTRGDAEKQIIACRHLFRLAILEYSSVTIEELWVPRIAINKASDRLTDLVASASELSVIDLRRIVDELVWTGNKLPEFALLERQQRIIDENHGWQSHSRLLMGDWSGYDHYADKRTEYHRTMASIRVLAVQYAAILHHREIGAYPESLDQLVPDYFSAVPGDPFSDAPLVYQADEDGFEIYSVGREIMTDEERAAKIDLSYLSAAIKPTGE